MATARKAPAKRAAPKKTAAAPKKLRDRKAGALAAGEGLDLGAMAQGTVARKRVAKRAVAPKKANGAAQPVQKVRSRVATAKNGAASPDDALDVQTIARVAGEEGEIVRKTRAGSTAEASVPVQTGLLKPVIAPPAYWERACADLVKRDRILKRLIPKFGPVHLVNGSSPFVTLARSVVGQQISVPSAQAVWARIEQACPKLAPQQFVKIGQENLIGCGLSKRKSEYLIDLARHFVSGALHVDKWSSMEDEAVIAELTQIRGIGRWTAEMFLIFNLSRPDVLPLDDLGLIRAISLNYFSGEPVTRSEAREVAANWEPWRTVATWYMWRSLDGAPKQ
jgi:DNA-3-methyladenine glycosylase II